MNILIIGDIVGRSGRECVMKYIPILKEKLSLDFIVANVDNAAHGFGITPDISNMFFSLGIDVQTGGNHIFDQKNIFAFLNSEKRLLRPYNMPQSTPGNGIGEYVCHKTNKKILVIHLLGQLNMPMIGDNPFDIMDKLLTKYKLGENIDSIIVDYHADTTSEKNAFGQFLDGRVSIVIGTHTHIPTADARIFEKGTAFQTDLGMCGDYDSVIGMLKNTAVECFAKIHSSQKLSSAYGEATLCGLFAKINNSTGLATSVKSIRLGGMLEQTSLDISHY